LLLKEYTHNVNNRKIMGNIALNKTATASGFVMPYSASKAVDGSLTPFNRWLCNTVPSWMGIDSGGYYLVNRWVVRHLPVAGWASPDYANCDFKLQGSPDNRTWYDVDAVVNNTTAITDRTIAIPVVYRFFRVYFTKGLRTNTQMASMVELEVYQAYSGQLTNLTISSGTLTPAFNTNTYAYTATVTPDVASINVTPTALSPTAVIKVNNVTVTSGQPSPVALNFGSNTITVNVTDGAAIQNYTITVTRLASNYLSGLTAQSGTTNIPLAPAFNKDTSGYTTSVGYDVASITVTPTAENSASTITVNGVAVTSGSASGPIALNVGSSNTITIVVTNAGAARTYTITVTRADSAYLSGLTAQSGSTAITLSPTPFVKTTMGYSASVGYDVPSVTVTPTAEGASAAITVNGVPVVSGQPSASISLVIGTTTIPVVVTAGGVTQNYSITITRVDTSLSGLAIMGMPGNSPMTLAPGFQATIFAYTSTTGKGKVAVTPTTAGTGSTIQVNGTTVASGSVSQQITLTGKTTVQVTVTLNNITTTYKIVVN
jgi:hypothetical protein